MSEEDDLKVSVPSAVTHTARAAEHMITHAPHMLLQAVLVGMFLWYLERHDRAEQVDDARIDQVSELRIQTCHDVQERSIEVMSRLETVLIKEQESIETLNRSFQEFKYLLNRHLDELNEDQPYVREEDCYE